MDQPIEPKGRVAAVRGAVVDIVFDDAELPRLEEALVVEWDQPEALIVEVQAHIDERTLRGVALQATAGLRRGVPVRATGHSITVPVGDPVLGRLLDVVGGVRDNGPPLPANLPRAAIHRAAPPLADRSPSASIFQTGIKVIDLLAPLAQGGQGGDVRRCRRRQDRGDHGAHPRNGEKLSGHLGVRGHRRALARGARAAGGDAAIRRARPQRSRLWPDERAARRALASWPDGADDRRVFPRRGSDRTCCC